MKKYISLIFAVLFTFSVFAVDVKELYLSNGIPVYAVKNTSNKIDTVSLVVKGGVFEIEPEYSGIEAAVFNMIMRGSKSYSFDDIKDFIYETGSQFNNDLTYEYSSWNLTTIDDYLNDALKIMIDGFVNPVFPESEYSKMMTEYNEYLSSMLNNPVQLTLYYAMQTLFQNHPYQSEPNVNLYSLKNITIPAIKNHHEEILDSRRIYIVAVTNSDPESYLPVLEEGLGKIKAKGTVLCDINPPELEVSRKPLVVSHQAARGTGYFFRSYKVPAITSDDYIPFVVANKIYSQNFNIVMRQKYGMCYTAATEEAGMLSNFGFEILYNCSDVVNIKSRMNEARNITAEGNYITGLANNRNYILSGMENSLEAVKNSLINTLYSTQLTTAGVADVVKKGVILFGDPNAMEDQYKQIKDVTLDDVLTVFNKYIATDKEFWFACVAPEVEDATELFLAK